MKNLSKKVCFQNAIQKGSEKLAEYREGKKLVLNFYDSLKENKFICNNFDHDIFIVIKAEYLKYIYTLKKDKIIYRARIYDKLQSNFNIFKKCNFGSILLRMYYKIYYYMLKYKGYSKKNSGAPHAKIASEGRANPKGVSYLYASEDDDTCCYEVRPIIDQDISIATIRLNKDIQLLDFTETDPTKINHVFYAINEYFSKPNHYTSNDFYFPTQIIAEFVKSNLHLDGIRFKSSLKNGGINIVIFNKNCYSLTGSNVYTVKNVFVELEKSHSIQ